MSLGDSVTVIEQGDRISATLAAIMDHHQTTVWHLHRDDLGDPVLPSGSRPSVGVMLVLDADRSVGEEIELVGRLHRQTPELPIIVLVEDESAVPASGFTAAGATDVISVPLAYTYLLNRRDDFEPEVDHAEPQRMTLKNGREVVFRFLHPDDADIEQDFVRGLSDRSRYLRFFAPLKELPPALLDAFTHAEFPQSYAVIATEWGGEGETQVGVARYTPTTEAGRVAEFAVVVADDWQGVGLARALMHIIIMAATLAGHERLEGTVLRDNAAMRRLASKLGFSLVPGVGDEGPGVLRYSKRLTATDEDPAG